MHIRFEKEHFANIKGTTIKQKQFNQHSDVRKKKKM